MSRFYGYFMHNFSDKLYNSTHRTTTRA